MKKATIYYKSKSYYDEKNVEPTNRTVPFAVVESYKAIRTNLMFLLSQTRSHTFEISSSLPGEGKSSCAVNLAIAFSQLGSKILLIDADLRKPSVYRKLRLQNAKGLSSVLVDFCSFSEAVMSINANFDVLLSGPIPPNPSELLGSEQMTRLLDSVKDKYDYIIIDTPPINVVSDAVVLAAKTEGIVMVVQDKKTTHDEFKKAVSSLSFADARLLGVVLNSSADKNAKYSTKSQRYQY
ncbi:MAG: CpsD/CapB family tyrosine-protein kinase [Clostridia bacterium]|nr:CpsD/CapB family tyrosine-protein kinase [Clostridia bacterium]